MLYSTMNVWAPSQWWNDGGNGWDNYRHCQQRYHGVSPTPLSNLKKGRSHIDTDWHETSITRSEWRVSSLRHGNPTRCDCPTTKTTTRQVLQNLVLVIEWIGRAVVWATWVQSHSLGCYFALDNTYFTIGSTITTNFDRKWSRSHNPNNLNIKR